VSDDWTAADVPDQRGRRAVVTGATSGIGLVASRELARAGAEVVLAVRDPARGEQVAQTIREAVPGAHVEVRRLDLADLASVRAFAAAEDLGDLDLLINNAGVMAIPYRRTTDGFEMQLGTNHLGHFALTGLLLPRLLARPEPRVVTVSSGAHRMGRMNFDDLNSERGYRRWPAYGQSKLANLLFAYELQRRADAAGWTLRSVAAHPGYAATNLQLVGPRMRNSRIEEVVSRLGNVVLAQSAERGALPSLYAATVPQLPGGAYVGPNGFLEMRGHPHLVGSSSASKDPETARRLWEASERLTGVTFPGYARGR
jgi:NAD(P)-dependent dehydrogenase (short-subunit alcohol dehydrogenase family)